MPSMNIRPSAVNRMPMTPMVMSVVYVAVFVSRRRFEPYSCEITTEQPTLAPIATCTMRNTIDAVEPTPASSELPTNWPTRAVWTML